MKLLIIDNNDSFTYNLLHQIITVTDCSADVCAYQQMHSSDFSGYDAFIISPGPGHPSEYKDYGALIDSGRPVFGVCLGMQIINCFFGGKVERLPECRHGVARDVVMGDLSFRAAVYNSLYCSVVSKELNVTAVWENIPMAVRHKERPVAGVQFHPESFLTENGNRIIKDVFSSIGIV